MWGRELRAGLAFVLVSLLVGTLVREWQRDHRVRFEDLVADLEEAHGPGSAPAPRADSSQTTATSTAKPTRTRRTPEPALRPGGLEMDRATASDWERLPGIGPSLAARIVADRAERGPFRTPEGLLRVRGIGPRTLERIRPYLTPAPVDSGSPIAN
ncbi:MAG TPA: helix-hairpin-helix domain-containing protein [Candidatus Eisenbacteria bacterium]|nr:helix-hairpin-helix domain-containing protein [Candidatus Eisenbacteria bacterium]